MAFSKLVAQLAARGARDPEALAAWIGRRKYGKQVFAKLAQVGQDRARAEGEAQQRHQRLMSRVRPGGDLADDLTAFSDEELGQALRDLTPEEALRVATEMDRRDIAASLPGARPDLIGLSDEQLGERARTASSEELAAIAAEADRRQRLAEVFPGGHLARDLEGVPDDTLGWAIRYAGAEEAEGIAAEIDRRHPPAPRPVARGPQTVRGQLADHAAIDQALAPAAGPDDWGWLALDQPDEPADRSSTERWIAEREAAAKANRGNYSREQVREMYREHVYAQWLEAETELRGVLLSRNAAAAGVDPVSLFTGPAHIAYARASEELKRYWADRPRTTLAEYVEQITGEASEAAATARTSRNHRQNQL